MTLGKFLSVIKDKELIYVWDDEEWETLFKGQAMDCDEDLMNREIIELHGLPRISDYSPIAYVEYVITVKGEE